MNSALRLAAPLLLLTAATWTGAADLQIKFKGPTGLYSVEQWKKDGPGCGWQDGVAEGNLSLVERAGTHYLRVDYQPGEIGPEENGCGWRSVPTFGVDSIDFETFHGGSNKSWAPKKASWAEFGAISLE
jgi:hypothetical protein